MSIVNQDNRLEIIDEVIKKFDALQSQGTGTPPVVIEFLEELMLILQSLRDTSPKVANEINIQLAAYSIALGKIRTEYNRNNNDGALEIWGRSSENIRPKLVILRTQMKGQESIDTLSIAGKSVPMNSITAPISVENARSIQNTGQNMRAGPGGFYVIRQIPSDWKVQQLSLPELMNHFIAKFTDNEMIKEFFGEATEKNILLIRSKDVTTYAPIIGKSTFNGRLLPLFNTDWISNELIIFPVERIEPPFYIRKNLIQSFFSITSNILLNAIFNDLSSGKLDNGIPYLYAQVYNKIGNVDINGEIKSFFLNVKAFAFEGELKDFVLLIRYPSFAESNENLKKQHDELMSIVSSFSPIGSYDEEQMEGIKVSLENSISEDIRNSTMPVFVESLRVALGRIKGINLENIENLAKVISSFAIYLQFANQIEYSHELVSAIWEENTWKDFWNSIDQAKKGNPTKFKELLKDLMDEYDIS